MVGASSNSEQIIDPRKGMTELSSLLSTPLGARTVRCHSNFTVRDVVACLRGGVISAVFSCAFFLAAARNFMLNVLHPGGGPLVGLWGALEPALWACVITSFVLVLLYSLDNRRSLTIDPFGLIINTQLHEGIETRLLVPWHWLSRIGVKKTALGFGGTEFHMETKYGMVYTLQWDEVATSTVTETLIAAVRTLAPQAEIDLGEMQQERASAQDSFTEIWMRSLSSGAQRERTGSLTPDTVLADRYRVVGSLGAGGQGTAYLAIDEKLDSRDVVLKEYILPAHAGSDILSASQQRIDQEIALLSSLQHPSIVRIFDSFTEDYRGYLVLEFVSGSQLKELVETQGPMDENSVIEIAFQVCQILRYLHGLVPRVIHQDITPDNLIRQEDGTVKLVDFNVARKFASDGSTVVVGKHAYIPPEQFRGRANPQSDIYALGCTMHFLLTGKEPEPMTTSYPVKIKNNVSKELNKIVAKATALSLADRFADVRELEQALVVLRPNWTHPHEPAGVGTADGASDEGHATKYGSQDGSSYGTEYGAETSDVNGTNRDSSALGGSSGISSSGKNTDEAGRSNSNTDSSEMSKKAPEPKPAKTSAHKPAHKTDDGSGWILNIGDEREESPRE